MSCTCARALFGLAVGPTIHEGNAIVKNLDLLSNAISITAQDELNKIPEVCPGVFCSCVVSLSDSAATGSGIDIDQSFFV